MLDGLRRRYFPKGVRRAARKQYARLFRRTTRRGLARTIRALGVPDGAPVCVHSMLSGLGHLVGGPATVVDAIRDAVPGATVMVPTFPFGGTCEDHLARDPLFDPAATPSRSGLLTETIRLLPDARRSVHPTHPCAAVGPDAAALIDGSENALTPFGDDATYGRFAAREDAALLLLHTNNTSLVHRFQEVAGTPNLFLDGTRTARGLDASGKERTYRVRVHRGVLPLYVILRGDREDEREYVWLPDYCLPAPDYNRVRVSAGLHSRRVRDFLFGRHAQFVKDGVVRTVRHRGAEVIAVMVRPFLERICRDLRASYEAFADEYALDELERARANGYLSKERTLLAVARPWAGAR